MNKIASFLILIVLILFISCSDDFAPKVTTEEGSLSAFDSDGSFSSSSSGSSSSGAGNGESVPEQKPDPGLITAAEWNDLDNWDFWNDLISGESYSDKPDYWNFYNNNRISVLVKSRNQPVIDAQVQLLKNKDVVWESKTDNFGKAELWIDLCENNNAKDYSDYSLKIEGKSVDAKIKPYAEGVSEIELDSKIETSNNVDLNFIVDATGSMGDELEFLKVDLEDVIDRVKDNNSNLKIRTSAVFYRDREDDYVVRESKFTDKLNTTLKFIRKQSAQGGGDFPEAVHSALKEGIEELKWSKDARTRIAFLLLDAPPHHDPQVIDELQKSIKEAAKKGIKVIPITASGIDKETEFLMRFFSITTNGTYVFITDDSGIGNDHLEASVGEHEIEYLNDLMVRLIGKYTE